MPLQDVHKAKRGQRSDLKKVATGEADLWVVGGGGDGGILGGGQCRETTMVCLANSIAPNRSPRGFNT